MNEQLKKTGKKGRPKEGSQEGSQEINQEIVPTVPGIEHKSFEPVVEIKQILLDPRTGKPLRNQSPGVPNSPWVGKHSDGNPVAPKNKTEERLLKDWED